MAPVAFCNLCEQVGTPSYGQHSCSGGRGAVLILAESYLAEHGHKTFSAATLEQALALIDSDKEIDLLFTDVGLGGNPQAGLELAQQAVERRPKLHVLYTTGQTLTDGMKELFVKGSAFLAKPYTVEQLTTTL